MTSINWIWLPWLQLYSWEHRHLRAPVHVRARIFMQTAELGRAAYQRCWFDGGDVFTDLAVERPTLVRCRPQLWPGVPVHGLIPHASMVLQGGGKGGDSGAGCFPGPPRSFFPLELLSVPNLPESSTHPALNASFPLLAPRLLRASPSYERKGHCQTNCRQHRKEQPLDVVVRSLASSSWKTGGIKRLRWMKANYTKPTMDNQKDTSVMCLPDSLLFRFKMQEIFGRKNGFPVFLWSNVVPCWKTLDSDKAHPNMIFPRMCRSMIRLYSTRISALHLQRTWSW